MGTHLLCFGQTINAPTIPAVGVEFTVKNMSTAVSNVPVNGVWDFSNEVTTDGQNFKLLPNALRQLCGLRLCPHSTQYAIRWKTYRQIERHDA